MDWCTDFDDYPVHKLCFHSSSSTTVDDKKRRKTLWIELRDEMVGYENCESTVVLEMALWKMKLVSGRSCDGSKRVALDREQCLLQCGSNVVVPSVAGFFGFSSVVELSDLLNNVIVRTW